MFTKRTLNWITGARAPVAVGSATQSEGVWLASD